MLTELPTPRPSQAPQLPEVLDYTHSEYSAQPEDERLVQDEFDTPPMSISYVYAQPRHVPSGRSLRRAHKTTDCSCHKHALCKLCIDVTVFVQSLYTLWYSILDCINAVKRVTSVSPFVTGFWEVQQRKEYCIGPIKNPIFNAVDSEKIYVVVQEDVLVLAHSLWPALEGVPEPSMPDGHESSFYYSFTTRRPLRQFPGQFLYMEAQTMHEITHALLCISRSICLGLFMVMRYILPRPISTHTILDNKYEVFPALASEQAGAETASRNGDGIYKPLRPDLIRGRTALAAARRAGFTFDL